MLHRLLCVLSLALCALPATAQLTETFTDGDFTQNPTWTGDGASFQVTSQQLQSNGPATTGTQIQLVTPVQAAVGTTWEFWANLRLATSSGNLADVWLISEQADLKATGNRGYFVRIGGTPDEVALFRKDATGSPAYVINGTDGTISSSNNNLVRVRVTRTVAGQWTLERDLAGGTTYVSEGSAPDDTYQRSQYLGVLLTYSSANSRAFYFDDFRVTDTGAPLLTRATAISGTIVDAQFNEPVAANTPASAFRLASGAVPTSIIRDPQDPALVHLTFGNTLPLGTSTLEARNVADLYGNVAAGPLTASFTYNGTPIAPGFNQLLITEILADETPQVGLPASEFIEIYNPSTTNPLDLGGVRLQKPGATAAVFGSGATLLPGEYAVVCASNRVTQFASYGKVFGLTNFPSLSNAGDQLLLRGRDGRTIFEVRYADTWYRDNRKKDGGWTLEMVDPGNPCGGMENWTASNDVSGGTPGRANSVRATNPDRTPPALLRAVASTPTLLRLTFAEKLDSALTANAALYALPNGGPTVLRVAPVPYDFRTVELTLAAPLTVNQPYTVTVQRATDCAGNASGPLTSATIALPSLAVAGDVVVNEILFNPRTNAYDFVELLNRSSKYVDLQGWTIGREKPDGTIEQQIITNDPYVLAPGQLAVLTERPDVVQAQYPTSNEPAAFLPALNLPTYPDDAGVVLLNNAQNVLIDRLAYSESMHLALLDTRDGVSLERIRADGPSTATNFHSAAGSVGYATPGQRNSQYQQDPSGNQQFVVEPEVFTPDEDGQQDFTTLTYRLDGTGYAASVTVYDAQGRLMRRLVRNETLATTGFFQWDGLTDSNRKAPIGYYVLHIELYKPGGSQKKEYKKTVVLGARL